MANSVEETVKFCSHFANQIPGERGARCYQNIDEAQNF